MESQTQTEKQWAKIEIMGHETYFGWIEQSPWLSSGIRAHILPPGDEEGKDPEWVKDWGESSIFGITPLSEERARTLSRRSGYSGHVLKRREEGYLARERIQLQEAKKMVEEDGHAVVQEEALTTLGDELVEKMRTLNLLVDRLDLGEDLERTLSERARSAREAVQECAPDALYRWGPAGDDTSFVPEDELPFDEPTTP